MPHPWWGTSNEYPQDMFLCWNKKNIYIFWLKKQLIWSFILFAGTTDDGYWSAETGQEMEGGSNGYQTSYGWPCTEGMNNTLGGNLGPLGLLWTEKVQVSQLNLGLIRIFTVGVQFLQYPLRREKADQSLWCSRMNKDHIRGLITQYLIIILGYLF